MVLKSPSIFSFTLLMGLVIHSHLVSFSAYSRALYVCSTEGAVYLSGYMPSLHLQRFSLWTLLAN